MVYFRKILFLFVLFFAFLGINNVFAVTTNTFIFDNVYADIRKMTPPPTDFSGLPNQYISFKGNFTSGSNVGIFKIPMQFSFFHNYKFQVNSTKPLTQESKYFVIISSDENLVNNYNYSINYAGLYTNANISSNGFNYNLFPNLDGSSGNYTNFYIIVDNPDALGNGFSVIVTDNGYDQSLADQFYEQSNNTILGSINSSIGENNNLLQENNKLQEELNDFLSDDTVNTDGLEFATDDTVNPTLDGFDTLFTSVYNAFCNTSSEPLSITLPFVNQTFSISPTLVSDAMNSCGLGVVLSLIHSFYYYCVCLFIYKDINRIIEKLKSGNLTSVGTNVKTEVL